MAYYGLQAQAQNAQAANYAAQNTAKRESLLETGVRLNGRLSEIKTRLTAVAEAIIGPQLHAVDQAETPGPDPSIVCHINRAHSYVTEIEEILQRLQTSL